MGGYLGGVTNFTKASFGICRFANGMISYFQYKS